MAIEFKCPDCGPQKTMLFDASMILERQFEGLWFVLSHDSEGQLVVANQPKDAIYLSDYNMAKHLATAVELASDDGGGNLYCPICKEPVA